MSLLKVVQVTAGSAATTARWRGRGQPRTCRSARSGWTAGRWRGSADWSGRWRHQVEEDHVGRALRAARKVALARWLALPARNAAADRGAARPGWRTWLADGLHGRRRARPGHAGPRRATPAVRTIKQLGAQSCLLEPACVRSLGRRPGLHWRYFLHDCAIWILNGRASPAAAFPHRRSTSPRARRVGKPLPGSAVATR